MWVEKVTSDDFKCLTCQFSYRFSNQTINHLNPFAFFFSCSSTWYVLLSTFYLCLSNFCSKTNIQILTKIDTFFISTIYYLFFSQSPENFYPSILKPSTHFIFLRTQVFYPTRDSLNWHQLVSPFRALSALVWRPFGTAADPSGSVCMQSNLRH